MNTKPVTIESVRSHEAIFSYLNRVFCDGYHSRRGQRQPGPGSASAPMAGYPKRFNIETDPHEDLNVFGLFPFAAEPAMKEVEEYLKSVKQYPNPPAPNITQFQIK